MKLRSLFSKHQIKDTPEENTSLAANCILSVREESENMDKNLFRTTLDLMETISCCNVLKSKAEIRAASYLVGKMGLPFHNDYQKNWDTLKALSHLVRNTDNSSNILDAGGGIHSPVLNALAMFGYNNLYACDVVDVNYTPESFSKTINFSIQNIENTDYPDKFFNAVTSLSVIEHGVNHERFFAEMYRILIQNGLLIITTDYWPEHIDCSGIFPYGPDNSEMKVYNASEIENIIQVSNKCGFDLCAPLMFDVGEKAIRWDEVDREYTFIFFVMKKRNSELLRG